MKLKIRLAALFITAAGLLGALPQYSIPGDVPQGGVLSVIVWDQSPLDAASAVLEAGGRRVSKSDGFVVNLGEAELYCRLLLVPVSSTQAPGTGELTLTVVTGGREIEVSRTVEILAGTFIHEDIPLSTAMSDLRQSDDPEKAKQSQALYDLLITVNPDHVYMDSGFSYPMDPDTRRTSFYGDRRRFLYTDGKEAGSIHFGIDFSANPGTPISSDGQGVVVFSGERILTGNTVVVEHLPGVYSLYYHMQKRYLSVGDRVVAGTPVGTVGSTGLVTGAHLHWEIRVNGVPIAPDPLIKSPLLDKNAILSIVKER